MEKDLHPELKPAYQMSRNRRVESILRLSMVFEVLLGGFGTFIVFLMNEGVGWVLVIGGFGGAFLFHWIKRLFQREERVKFQLATELLETVPPRPMMIHFKSIWDWWLFRWIATMSDVSAPKGQALMKVFLEIKPKKLPDGQSEVSVYFKSNPERLLLIRINGKISLARQLY